jgi:hypothetical protein
MLVIVIIQHWHFTSQTIEVFKDNFNDFLRSVTERNDRFQEKFKPAEHQNS